MLVSSGSISSKISGDFKILVLCSCFFFYQNIDYNAQTVSSWQKLIKQNWNVTNNKHYLTTYATKIVRVKQKRRNNMYNDNHNDIYDNNNIGNKIN